MKKIDYKKKFILDNYSTKSTSEIAEELELTEVNVRQLARRLGVNKSFNNDIINGYKLCSVCQRLLPVNQFYKDCYAKNGLRFECIRCFKKGNNRNNRNAIATSSPPANTVTNTVKAGGGGVDKQIIKLDHKKNPIIVRDGIEGLVCKNCNIWKPLDDFHRNKSNKSGRLNSCKECEKKRLRKGDK